MCECFKNGVVRNGRFAYNCMMCCEDVSFIMCNMQCAGGESAQFADELVRKSLEKKYENE